MLLILLFNSTMGLKFEGRHRVWVLFRMGEFDEFNLRVKMFIHFQQLRDITPKA